MFGRDNRLKCRKRSGFWFFLGEIVLVLWAAGFGNAYPAPAPTPVLMRIMNAEAAHKPVANQTAASPVLPTDPGLNPNGNAGAVRGYVISGPIPPAPQRLDDSYQIRVMLYRGPGPVTISSSQGFTVSERKLSAQNSSMNPSSSSSSSSSIESAGASLSDLSADLSADSSKELEGEKKESVTLLPGGSSRELLFTPLGSSLCVAGRSYRGQVLLYDDGSELMAVNYVFLEDYLRGVVPEELLCSKLEAVKAQAVLARTYALSHKRPQTERYDVRNDSGHQVYGGISAEHTISDEAVAQTAGLVLGYKQGLAKHIVYHSTCGGQTESNEYAFGTEPVPYLRQAECMDGEGEAGCARSSYATWVIEWNPEELGKDLTKGLRKSVGPVRGLEILEASPSGRVLCLVAHLKNGEELELRGDRIRSALLSRADNGKLRTLPSTRFVVEDTQAPELIRLRGTGWGHGVGMCQWGAMSMAQAGCSFLDILDKYYVGTTVVTVGSTAIGR